MKYFRRFCRHIREGFVGVKRHFGMAFSASSAVTITLLLVGVFTVFAANMAYLTKEIEQSISLVALIDYGTDAGRITALKNDIEAIEGVDHVVFRDKEEELDFYIQEYGKDESSLAEFSENYRGEDNPFHDTFIIYAVDGIDMENIKNTVAYIKKMQRYFFIAL